MTDYYDALAPYYKLMYMDWEKSVSRQANDLHSVIQEFLGPGVENILDVACGIGTQSIGLAKLGYIVSASDISSEEIENARKEAIQHGVDINFQVADMRAAWDTYHSEFDIVLACDNAVPHLLSDEEILMAFRQFFLCTKPNGACLISVRDYASFQRTDNETRFIPRLIHKTDNGKIVIFDTWQFTGNLYDMTTYIIHDTENEINSTVIRGGKYYCVTIPILESLFRTAGFQEITVLYDRFFQPLIIARKSSKSN